MKFSTKAEYGLKAMTNLALSHPKKKSSRDISKEEGISLKYLERLIGELRKAGIVQSYKGKQGGYALSGSPRKTNVGQIVEALEGPISTMGCEDKKCLSVQCRPKKVWIELGKQIKKTLYNIKLSDLIK